MAFNRYRARNLRSEFPRCLFLLILTSIVYLTLLYAFAQSTLFSFSSSIYTPIKPFDCYSAPQARPVIANAVEGIKFPFLYSLSDFGNYPDTPHRNLVRTLKGKPFRKPGISATVQELLEKMKRENRRGVFVDVGADVGIATFAAAAMGFRVVAFEPVFENLQRICDGIYFNRVADLVRVFEVAAADQPGKLNITLNKPIRSVAIDDVIKPWEPVVVLKIGVQGWEHNVLKGASKLLSRSRSYAPYLIYEEDDRLLESSNSSAQAVRDFLHGVGYRHCIQHGSDLHCTKTV